MSEPWTDGAPICKALAWEMFGVNDVLDVVRGIRVESREQHVAIGRAFSIIKYSLRECGIAE